jgi:hypothetical protein
MNTTGWHWVTRAGLAAVASLQITLAQTVPPSLAAPAGLVDTSKPGFKMRIVQGNSTTPMTGAAPAEGLLSGKILDATTGLPLNNATPNDDGTYFYIFDKYINLHEQAANGATGGNFSTAAAAPHNVPDDPEPGIPGVTGSGDYFVMEFTGFLQLPAGTVRFGVNSDDGFKLTIGSGINPRIQALQLIILDGTRGFGNTEANITVTQAGIYPFRLLFWEQTGANSGVELFTFAPGSTSGNRYLINDTAQANSIKSYRELLGNPPSILSATPALTSYVDVQGTAGPVPPAPYVWVEVMDGATALDPGSVKLTLDTTPLTPVITKSGTVSTIAAQAPMLPAGSVHTNSLIYADAGGRSFTNVWTFTVGSYPTIPAAYAIASVDASKPGFKVKGRQMAVNRNPSTGNVPNAERQYAGGYTDAATGQPYANTLGTKWLQADGTEIGAANAEGFFEIPDVINWNETAPANLGNFSAGSTPPREDKPVPGLTGNTDQDGAPLVDRTVYSIETILELKAGPIRFGVNSDDGFRLSAGRGPGDVVGIQFGTAGDRSAADSFMDCVIPADGFYPFRLMWFETGGGSGCEFFTVDLATGTKTLINDLASATAIKAYRESAATRPYISRTLPSVNYGYAFADQDLVIDISDGGIVLDPGSIELRLNGTLVTPTINKAGKVTTLTRTGSMANLLPSGVNNVELVYGFSDGSGSVKVTNTWSYTVPAYTRVIPAGNKVLASQVSGEGFRARAHQIDRSKDNNQGNGGRYTGQSGGGANMPRPEIQLADGYLQLSDGKPYPNLATAGPNADGSFDITEVLNFNSAQSAGGPAANAGIFNSDTQVPGLPGSGTSNFGLDNTVHEFTTYLELKAGAHVFGINVDDGWLCASAPNPRDTLGTLLGWRNAPGGQNGNPVNNPNAAFNVIVPEDGVYPFRILFWQGGGGVNFEFLSLDRNTGSQMLVNDVNGTYPSVVALSGQLVSPIKAYSTYTGSVRPWIKFSVYPMPTHATLWQNQHQQSGPGPITVKVAGGNPVDIANDEPRFDQALVNRPFGDAVGAVVADLGSGTVDLVFDGADVTPTVTDIPGTSDKLVMYRPEPPMASGSTHTAGLVYAGTTNYWTFTVISNVVIPAGISAPASAADQTASGFKVRVTQAAAARPGGNTVAAAESQLAGTPASVALPGPESDGSYLDSDIINWNVTMNPGGTPAQIGNFQTARTGQSDEPVPGIPGTGLSGAPRFENITAEIFAWLELPAGYQKFAVNGDDGWKVQIGQPGQTDGPILFTRDRGTGARDIPFAFITPEAGLYPVRLVWYQGGGGGNVEFFSYGPNNEKIAVNDRANPNAIKAWHKANVAPPGEPEITSIALAGGSVTILWKNAGTLESAPAVNGPWSSTGDRDGSFTEAVASEAKFYRVRR